MAHARQRGQPRAVRGINAKTKAVATNWEAGTMRMGG